MSNTAKIIALCSGGDAPGMNQCLRAIALQAKTAGVEVYAAIDGYKGLAEGQFVPLEVGRFKALAKQGGTIIGTSRYPRFLEPAVQEQTVADLKKQGFTGVIGIGGDGTFQGLMALNKLGMPTIGIPGTIDNDLPATDCALGFQTAVNNCVEALDKIRDTMESHHRLFIVQVMGRHCGDIALFAGIAAGADIILTQYDFHGEEPVVAQVKKLHDEGQKSLLIVTAERLIDIAQLAAKLQAETGYETRYDALGHLQRGGTPVYGDRILATAFGQEAVRKLVAQQGGLGLGVKDGKLTAYALETALTTPKVMPALVASIERNAK